MSRADDSTIRRYLEMAREETYGAVSQSVMDTLRAKFNDIWRKIVAAPNTYVMDKLEFSVFNYFNGEAPDRALAQRATERHWKNVGVDGSK
jgi:hypothetical protein